MMNKIYIDIAELLAKRSTYLFRDEYKKADALTQQLIDLWLQLPDKHPSIAWDITLDGITYMLQSVNGNNYRYVIPQKYKSRDFVLALTDRRTKLLTELHITETVHEEIKELEIVGLDPITEIALTPEPIDV